MSSQLERLTSIDQELAERLENDERFRNRYLRRWAQNEVAAEIRKLRKQRKMLQADVAKLAKTGQSAISRIEKAEYDGWTFKTLLTIGESLRARLRITFEPIEDVVGGYRATSEGQAQVFGSVGRTGDDVDFTSNSGTFSVLELAHGDSSAKSVVM